MNDPQRVVEAFDCNYNVGTAARALLEHAKGVDQAVPDQPTLRLALRHVILELRRIDPQWNPETQAHAYVEDMDSALAGIVEDLHELPPREQVLTIKGLLISAVRNTLEDLVGEG